jgi:hypothetical protein
MLLPKAPGSQQPATRNTQEPKVVQLTTPFTRMISSSSATSLSIPTTTTAQRRSKEPHTTAHRRSKNLTPRRTADQRTKQSGNLYGYKEYLGKPGAHARLRIVKYNPRNIRRESGATRSLRTLWVPEEDTRSSSPPLEGTTQEVRRVQDHPTSARVQH